MATTLVHVDAFTDRRFSGNPAAVCLLSEEARASWMQEVATEMNLSETAFLVPAAGGPYQLRWFTPVVEIPLCGHATLASAHAIWELGLESPGSTINFSTKSGTLTATRDDGLIWLNMPSRSHEPCALPAGIREAIGAAPAWEGASGDDLLVELSSEEAVRQLRPDLISLRASLKDGLIVTSRARTPGFDFVSRYFAPGVGIDEDPVTGSAHCALGPYWADRLGKSVFSAHQASRRGGDLQVRVEGGRVFLGGNAVTVLHGELL
jgi:PhzF family phenazine biosynthesis protein